MLSWPPWCKEKERPCEQQKEEVVVVAEGEEEYEDCIDIISTRNSIFDHIYAPFPEIEESQPGNGTTQITYAGAIRSALDKLIVRKEGVAIGQDIGKLGGVMTATAENCCAIPISKWCWRWPSQG